MQQQIEAQEKQSQKDAIELNYSRLKIQTLEEQLRLARIAKYGKASEKLSDLQLELLDLEPGVSGEEVQAESEREPLAASPDKSEDQNTQHKTNHKHPGRQSLPAHLLRIETIIACESGECVCGGCGKDTIVIGYEASEVLDVKPAEYFVRVVKREKRACKQCEEQGVAVAPVAECILPKSLVSDQVIIDTVVAKYCDSLPLYRQSAILKRDTGVDISRSTMDGWVMRVGELLMPLVSRMKNELLAGNYIQADETPVGVQTHDRLGKNHPSYLWQYGTPGGAVVFDFRMGREREGPKQFLGQFNGILQTGDPGKRSLLAVVETDGYSAYERIGGPKIVHAACLAHARRKYVEAVKVDARDQDSVRIITMMDKLFAIDAQARDEAMSHDERHLLRQEHAPALLAELRTQILSAQKRVLPKSAAGKAATYTLSLWKKLTLFLEYPELELSNNLAENSMRLRSQNRRNASCWRRCSTDTPSSFRRALLTLLNTCCQIIRAS